MDCVDLARNNSSFCIESSTAYSPNGEALVKSDFDAFRQSAFLLKRFASGKGFYSAVMRLTFSVTKFVAPKFCFSCRLSGVDSRDTSSLQPPMHQDPSVQQMLFFTPLRAISWLTAQIFRWRDWLTLCLDWRLRRQSGPHCLCSSLIQRSGSIHIIPYGYPALLALAQYFVEVGFDDTWQVSAHDLARSCISRVISTVSALLLELHDADSHTDPDFRASLDKIRVRDLSSCENFIL